MTPPAPPAEEVPGTVPDELLDRAPGYAPPASGAGLLAGGEPVDEQLRRLEVRLVAEAGGDRDREREVRTHLVHARARFASATIGQFMPILIEREVRRCMAQR